MARSALVESEEKSKHRQSPELTPDQATVALARPILVVEEAAWYLGVSRRWLVREGVRKAKVPYHRPPGSNKLLFSKADLDDVLESWRVSDGIGTPPKDRKKSRKSKKR